MFGGFFMNNKQSKIKSFLNKYKKALIFSCTLILSGVIFYYFAFAESEDDNKFTINNIVLKMVLLTLIIMTVMVMIVVIVTE